MDRPVDAPALPGGRAIYRLFNNYNSTLRTGTPSIPCRPSEDPGNYVLRVDECPDDPKSGKNWHAYSGNGYHGCTSYQGMMGTTAPLHDGIFFHASAATVWQNITTEPPTR